MTNSERLETAQQRDTVPSLLAFLCLLLPALPTYVLPPYVPVTPARAIAVFCLILAGLGLFQRLSEESSAKFRVGIAIVLLYLILELVVVAASTRTTVGDDGTAKPPADLYLLFLLGSVGVALYTIVRTSSTRARRVVLGALLIGLSYCCFVGAMQSFMGVDLRLLFMPPGFLEFRAAGVSATLNVPTSLRDDASRAFSTMGHPIEFAALAAVTFPLTIHFARFANRHGVRLLALLGVPLAFLGVLSAGSRSGLVALASSLIFYLLGVSRKDLGRVGPVILVGGPIAAVIIASNESALRSVRMLWNLTATGAQESSVQARLNDYDFIGQVARAHPMLGLGIIQPPAGTDGSLDNEWLSQFMRGGFVGLTAIAILVVGGLFGIAVAIRQAGGERDSDEAFALGAMFLGLVSTTFTFDLFNFDAATFVLFMVFGLLWATDTGMAIRPAVLTDPKVQSVPVRRLIGPRCR